MKLTVVYQLGRIRIGSRVKHLGTQAVRTVTGIRYQPDGNHTLHFNQCIKKRQPGKTGDTFYWSDMKHCRLMP